MYIDLPSLTDDYLRKIRETMSDRPRVYRPTSFRHIQSENWLIEHKIKDMWRETQGVKEALRLMTDYRERDHVEALIISPMYYTDYQDELPEWLSDAGYWAFWHYFFKTSLLATNELRSLASRLGGTHEIAFSMDPDPRMGVATLRYALGKGTMDIPISIAAKRAVDNAVYKMNQLSRRSVTKEDALMTKRYTDALESAQRMVALSGVAAEELIEVFMNFSISSMDEPEYVPSFQEYTGQPMIETHKNLLLPGGTNDDRGNTEEGGDAGPGDQLATPAPDDT